MREARLALGPFRLHLGTYTRRNEENHMNHMKNLSTDEVTVLQVLVDNMDERRLIDSIYELESFERPKLDGLLEGLAKRDFIRVHEGKPADGPFLSWVAHGGRGRAEQTLRSAKAAGIKT
jgi:hypothetical protein